MTRSHPLNKYYWGICIEMIKDRLNELRACPFLLSADDTHYLIKSLTRISTTTKMDNKDFIEFLEQVWCIGSHLEIYIPDPNENSQNIRISGSVEGNVLTTYQNACQFSTICN